MKEINGEKNYLDMLEHVMANGYLKENRTGVSAYTVPHIMLQHDMSLGFPVMTTKKMGIKSIAAELEFFIKGLTDKQWLKDRKCTIWNEWCNPQAIPEGLNDDERKEFQRNENDLGKVYGYQWRNFNSEDYDQLQVILNTLENNPNDRRMICSAWNPNHLQEQALPPCHMMWGVTMVNDTLNLWYMSRSNDLFLGTPYNLASYAMLLKLLAMESGFKEGIVTAFMADCHIYENHVDQVKEQLSRTPYVLPTLEIENFTGILNWKYTDVKLTGYQSHPPIKGQVAI